MNKLSTIIASFTFETVYIALFLDWAVYGTLPDIFFWLVCGQIILACVVYTLEIFWYKQELKPYLPKWLIIHNFICCLPIFIGVLFAVVGYLIYLVLPHS